MKSAATFALCALLLLGYCSRTRGNHQVTDTPASLPVTPTPVRGDGKTVQEFTAPLPQKPSPTLNSSAAVVLHSTPAGANKTDEPAASPSADASGSTDAAHSAAPPPAPVGQPSTVAPALIATNAAAVPTASAGASGTPQTGSAVSTTTAAAAANPPTIPVSAGNQTQAPKQADPSSKDNSTLSTSPSSTAAPAPATATAGPPPTTKPTEAKTESASTTTTATATTIMPATVPMTPAATAIPQSSSSSSPVAGHKKPTGNSTPSRSTATTSPTTTSTTTIASATTTSSLTTSTTTTSPIAAPGHPTQATLSELKVGDDDDSAKGVPDPLLAGLVSVFVVAAAIVSLLVFLKFRKRNERPEFRRLQDLPMDDMMEDTPLSMYSY